MKKQLLTSTALVAVAGAVAFAGTASAQTAAKPTLSVGGFTNQIFGFAEQDHPEHTSQGTDGSSGFDVKSDTEIHFNGAVTLDNGINIRTRVELEGNVSNDQIDENWMRISGSFGLIGLGSQDGAAMQMVTGYSGHWAVGVGRNLAFHIDDWIVRPTGHAATNVNRVDLTGDAEKINYFTPRFAGFQLGATYSADSSQDTNGQSASTDEVHNIYELGANYVGKFGDVGLGAAIGYTEGAGATGGTADSKIWGAGLRVDFAGFRVSAGMTDREDGSGTAGSVTDRSSWTLGARYTFGPNAISVAYESVEDEPTPGAAEDKTDLAMISFRRTLGPGVRWSLNGMYADYEGATTGNTDDNGGYGLTTAVSLSF